MSTALAVFHGPFGRAALYRLNRPLAPHAHREGHLIFLVHGASAKVTIDGVPHVVDHGNAVSISPWEPHAFYPGDFGEGSVFLTLYITPRWFIEMSSDAGLMLRFGNTNVPLDDGLRDLVGKVSGLLADGHTHDHFPGYLYELTGASFARSWEQAPQDRRDPACHRVSDFRIRNAIRLMNERVADDCVLDRIARDAGLSRPHFYKLFRQNIGLTPNMYLNTLRLERSIHRLTLSGDPVTAIGLDLGFASQASFTRFFSNNIGMSPSDYRRASYVAA